MVCCNGGPGPVECTTTRGRVRCSRSLDYVTTDCFLLNVSASYVLADACSICFLTLIANAIGPFSTHSPISHPHIRCTPSQSWDDNLEVILSLQHRQSLDCESTPTATYQTSPGSMGVWSPWVLEHVMDGRGCAFGVFGGFWHGRVMGLMGMVVMEVMGGRLTPFFVFFEKVVRFGREGIYN